MGAQEQPSAPARQASLARTAAKLGSTPLLGDYLDVIRGAVRRTVIPPTREVEFLLGACAGFMTSLLVCWLLVAVVPLSVAMALLFVMLPLTLVSGIGAARVFQLRRRSLFTFEAMQRLERAEHRWRQKLLAIEQMSGGLQPAQLEEARQAALLAYFTELDGLETTRKVLASATVQRMLGPGS